MNIVIQHYNINEGLSQILKKVKEWLPSIELIVLFQHPNPSEKSIVRNFLIKGIMECLEMCFMEIVVSIHFVYNWHSKKDCWDVNELKTIIMRNCNINLLGCLTFSNDRSITIEETSLVNHPLQGVVDCRGWARMKIGKEQTFCVTKRSIF